MAQMLIIALAGMFLALLLVFAVFDMLSKAVKWIGGASFDE